MATFEQIPGSHLLSEIKRVIAPDAAVQNDDVVLFVGHAFQEGEPSCELHGLVGSAQPAAGKLSGSRSSSRFLASVFCCSPEEPGSALDQHARPSTHVLLVM